jgi:hypothetical protein
LPEAGNAIQGYINEKPRFTPGLFHFPAPAVPNSDVMVILTRRPAMALWGMFPKRRGIMRFGERELEAARRQILRRMQNPPSQQFSSQLKQELRAIDIELDNVKRIVAILADAPPVAPVHAGIAG